MTLSVNSLLPSSVSLADDESAFMLSLDETEVEERLGVVCARSEELDGQVAQKPACTDVVGSAIALPEDVVSASVIGGELRVRLVNGFNFDPIRPGAGATGTIEILVLSGADTLALSVLDGATDSLHPFATREISLDLGDAIVADSVRVEVILDSPEGDPVFIDADFRFRAEAVPGDVLVDEAEIRLEDKAVDVDPVDLDLEDLDEKISERVHSGAIRLELANPFSAEGPLTLEITGGTRPITKVVDIVSGETRRRVEFSGAELRSILGQDGVVMSAAGSVSAPSGTLTVTPSMSLAMKSQLEIVVGPKVEE